MLALQETTKWAGSTPNHIYLVEGFDRLLGYIPAGSTEPVMFKKFMRFSRRGREFTEVKLKSNKDKHIKRVKGSSGRTYEVDTLEMKCSCPGFTYRGQCKHLEMI